MLSKIGEILPRCRDYEKLFAHHKRMHLAITDLYLDVLKFCTEVKAVFRKAKSSSGIPIPIYSRKINHQAHEDLQSLT